METTHVRKAHRSIVELEGVSVPIRMTIARNTGVVHTIPSAEILAVSLLGKSFASARNARSRLPLIPQPDILGNPLSICLYAAGSYSVQR
jgi:hypothetical protein